MVLRKDKPLVKQFIARKSRRIPLKLKFKVAGQDSNGESFEEAVETLEVGCSGGRFLTQFAFRVGSLIRLKGPKGFVGLARVMWTKEDRKSDRHLLGFQLLESEEEWVIQPQYQPSSKRKPR